MFRKLAAAAASALFVIAAPVSAQQKWDMPTGYPASNFHTENIHQFAADVDKSTGGKLKITVHDSGSLFKANEIKRAVQGGQAQIGEIIISGYSNEDALYGVDSIPFLATSYGDSQKLWQASRQATEARLAKQGMKVLYAVAWPPQGIFSAKPINSAADLKGAKWRAYNPNTSRIAQLVGVVGRQISEEIGRVVRVLQFHHWQLALAAIAHRHAQQVCVRVALGAARGEARNVVNRLAVLLAVVAVLVNQGRCGHGFGKKRVNESRSASEQAPQGRWGWVWLAASRGWPGAAGRRTDHRAAWAPVGGSPPLACAAAALPACVF